MRPSRRSGFCSLLALVALASCSGGGGDGGTSPTSPTNTTVARVDISPVAPAAIVSGATTTFTAAAFTSANQPVSASITWTSSNDGVATVSGGVVTGHLVGTATITAHSGSISSAGVTVTVSAAAAAQLAVRTQPAGAVSGTAFTTQPVVEVRDAAGNPITSSTTATVTVAIASGGGTLGGTTTAVAVGGVATFSGLVITGLVGAHTLSFTATGLATATSTPFTLDAGVATQLGIRTQPVAGTAYAVFTTPAVVEVRDASGNVAASTAAITATIVSGGGALGGAATVSAVAGVATFTSLTVNGTAGARALTFTAGALESVTTASFSVAAAPPAVIALAPSALGINASIGVNPAASTIAITNTGVFPLTNLRVQSTTYAPAASGGWLAASFPTGTTAPASMQLNVTSAALALGTYTATVVVAGDGAAVTTSLTVTLSVLPPAFNAYGTSANKVSIVAPGSTFSPGFVTVVGGATTTPDPTVTFVARNTAIATVDATGKITAVAAGQVWVTAVSTQSNSDSVLVIVPRASGPVLRTGITRFAYVVGDTITAVVQLDTRGATVGAITATVSWPVWTGTGTFGAMTFVDVSTTGSPMSPVTTVDQTVNVIRINGLSAAGVTGVVQLATIRFRVASSGLNGIYLSASELLAADFSDLLATATFTQYPVIVP